MIEHLPQHYNTLSERYANIPFIATTTRSINPPPAVNNHDYQVPLFFIQNFRRYKVSQSSPKVLVEEFAIINDDSSKINNLSRSYRLDFLSIKSAIVESIYRIGFERNSDIIIGDCYAPFLQNIESAQWIPSLIVFNASLIVKSTSYLVQKNDWRKSQNHGSMASSKGLAYIMSVGLGVDPSTIHNTIYNPNTASTIQINYRLYQYFYPSPDVNPHGKYVLVSGCDTGFGHGLVIELDKQGFNVFATVYNEENQILLKNKLSSRATVFCLDITQPSHIDAAYKIVTEKTNTLHALVNNAGIDQDGLIDWITMDFMRKMMEVNFFGHVAMTKKFLPLLIAKRNSRVVNLCSVAGYLAAPSMSSYCASKFALESFSDCLRREMHPWGLHVSIIEPGYMRTPLIDGHNQVVQKMWNELSADVKNRWGENYLKNLMHKRSNNPFLKLAENPIKVVHALQHAVNNTKPYIRYRPGWQSSLVFFPLSMIPAWLTDIILENGRGRIVIPTGVDEQLKD